MRGGLPHLLSGTHDGRLQQEYAGLDSAVRRGSARADRTALEKQRPGVHISAKMPSATACRW